MTGSLGTASAEEPRRLDKVRNKQAQERTFFFNRQALTSAELRTATAQGERSTQLQSALRASEQSFGIGTQ